MPRPWWGLLLAVTAAVSAALAAGGSPASASSLSTAPAAGSPRFSSGWALRGAILDRTGRVLAADTPCRDISVRYEVLAARVDPSSAKALDAYLLRLASQSSVRSFGTKGTPERLAAELYAQVEATWPQLASAAGLADEELTRRARRQVAQVAHLKAAVKKAHGQDRDLSEEHGFRPLARVYGKAAGERLAASFKDRPWVRLTPAMARYAEDAVPFVHVLGQLGKADAARVRAEPPAADPVRSLREGERCGISGAERLGDAILRPWVDQAGKPHDGSDVSLTLDAELEREVYAILEKAVKKSEHPCGGAAVVLDVRTGEVLALVSYPGHAYDLSLAETRELLEDSRWTPMRFRAVSSQFPPGSTIKPATLYTSLAAGAVTTQTRVTCTGKFREDIPGAFRCWVYNRTGSTHGVETAETALRDSCNIYFYTAGDKVGAAALIAGLGRMGAGVSQGTGLLEESAGVLPTPEWLAAHRKSAPRYQRADAWNYAFGQGEISMTPLQMANLAATLARGRFEPVTLMKEDSRRVGAPREPGPLLEERWLQTVRRGLWRVVNEKGGTADVARLGLPQAVLCGKTGSAQASPRVVTWRFEFALPNGRSWSVEAPTLEKARELAPEGAKLSHQTILRKYPLAEDGELLSHAWFCGFTQDSKTPRGARPTSSCYALSVLVEYGGGGGKVAGPIARDIARWLLRRPRPAHLPSHSTASSSP